MFGVDKYPSMEYNFLYTAEVAEAISTPPVRQLLGTGKGHPPKGLPDATEGMSWGRAEDARNCHRCDGVLPG